MYRNRARWAVLLGAVLVLSAVTPSIALGQEQVTMTVTVVDDDGNPVSDVDLSATWDGGGPVNETTRANGQALVDVAAGENVTVRVHDDRYVRNEPFVVTDAGGGEVEIPVARAGSATVSVVDGDGPIGQAVVQLVRNGNYVVNTRTGGDGVHETPDIEQGEYQLKVFKAGYLRNTSTLDVDGDVSREVRISEDYRTVTVSVVDDHYDEPRSVRNATVRIPGVGTVATLSSGQTTISALVNDDYDVTVSKPGFETNTTELSVRESDTNLTVAIQRTPAISASAANQQVVAGETTTVTVTDEYGDAVSGAAVAVDGESVAETDDSGEARVAIESAGEHNVTASYGDLEATTTVTGVQPGADDGDEAPGTGNETVPELGPGFGGVAALTALLAVAFLLTRR